MSLLTFFSYNVSPSGSIINTDTRRQIIAKLKFMSILSPHEKIDSRNLVVENNSIFTALKRLFMGDSRQTTINFFSTTTERAIEIINSLMHSKAVSDRIICSNILNDLINSTNGIRAIQQTYNDDKLIICELDALIEHISSKLYEIKELHPDLFQFKNIWSFKKDSVEEQKSKSVDEEQKPKSSVYKVDEEEEE